MNAIEDARTHAARIQRLRAGDTARPCSPGHGCARITPRSHAAELCVMGADVARPQCATSIRRKLTAIGTTGVHDQVSTLECEPICARLLIRSIADIGGEPMKRSFAIVALGLCVASSAFAEDLSFDRPYWLDRSVIEALGRAEVDAPADTASFSVTFREVDDNSRDAMFAASDRARLAAAAIRSRGRRERHHSLQRRYRGDT